MVMVMVMEILNQKENQKRNQETRESSEAADHESSLFMVHSLLVLSFIPGH